MMSLINLGIIFPFPPHMSSEKVQHRRFHCVGFSKVGQVYHSEAKEAARISHHARRRCECLDLHKQQIPYMEGWSWQKFLVRRRHILIERDEDHSDTLIILQHPPVYTLGTSSSEKYLNFDIQNSPYDIYRTERGGEVTYHGPGQLVMYPILNLRYHKMDLHWYLRSLEEVIIRVLLSTFSVKASRLEGFTGVWVGNHKVAAIGIRVSRWVTYHGLALNVTADLAPFRHIVPCGIRDREVGNLKELLGTTEDANLMDVAHKSLIEEFSEVFQLSLDYRLISELDLPEGRP